MAIFIVLVFFDFKKIWKNSMHRLIYPNEKSKSDDK